MSNYELLKTAIDAVIKANDRAEITGSIMNQTLMAMVNSLGKGYQFVGVATPAMNPNTPDEKVFYLAMEAGTYANFGGAVLRTGLTVLTWDGSWHALTVFSTDSTPNHDSADLITSGAVYNAIKNDGGAYDVSAHFPTGGEGGGNTYTLANAITKVPINMRKGGMSIKFVDATTNKYVKHTFLNPTLDGFTNVNNWQGIIESAAGFHTIGSAKNHQLASVGAMVEEFGIKTVNELPTASASTMNKIYSIPTAQPVTRKRLDEYFTVETGIAPDYTDIKDLVTVTAIPDNAFGALIGEGKFIDNDNTNNKAYYFTSVRAENEWGYEVTVEEVASGKIARMRDESQYASNGTAWVADYHYADYTWESLSPNLSTLATKSEVAEVAHALELTALDCENMTSIEYAELVQKRDDGELIPGKWYRIVDYQTTTAQEDTQSADHQFDVIVRADAVNKLNENAFAAISHGDTYFTNAGAKLEAWELKYCLDNDTDRFAWADDTNGKGVIYWMRDEWGNECPYDFKNIQFKRYKIITSPHCENLIGLYSASGTGDMRVDTSVLYWSYTFCMIDTGDNSPNDVSVLQNKYPSDEGFFYKVKNNIIKPYYAEEIQRLNDNVFITDTTLCLIEGDYGEYYGFTSNILGDDCNGNTFGNNFRFNTLGNDCVGNVFGLVCLANTFGDSCNFNVCGENFSNNTIGNGSRSNTFKEYFMENLLNEDSVYNYFGINNTYNTFGKGFGNNTIGDNFTYNSFGGNCRYNTIGNDCKFIKFGNHCIYNTFHDNCGGIIFENDIQHIILARSYTENLRIKNGNQYITITSVEVPNVSHRLKNIVISQGVNNSTIIKTIIHATLGDAKNTTYQAQGSQEIEV